MEEIVLNILLIVMAALAIGCLVLFFATIIDMIIDMMKGW